MPQLFQVLKCYKCSVFQVHQTKKASKWQCKLCGEKQSIKRHYGLGTGKECRLHVQKLNGLRGEMEEINESSQLYENSDEDDTIRVNNTLTDANVTDNTPTVTESKWSNFIDKPEPVREPDSNESMYLGNTEVVLEVPLKKRRKFNTPQAIQKPIAASCQNKLIEGQIPNYWQNKPFVNPNLSSETINTYAKEDSPLFSKTANFTKLMLPEKQVISLNIDKNKNNDLEEIVNDTAKTDKNPVKVFIPPKVNKNSKWAQFTDDPEEEDQVLSCEEENAGNKEMGREKSPEYLNKPSKLFALCDEDELDDVLAL